ncbi:hypothetical protein ETAA8_29650 [Anatilimnocola aggregata]|uniref:Uncharacterized protein n=1 Tax=Anatilimnocola aggregata TaxID=2528021 RepID=A0A517YCC1_9BACT|nr:hypothetical protein [Anatilimnocola aggregata]QDU27874.1 hypothetical protein ETAA8_29650 [Anatilimnocola aggregata]
MRKTVSFASLLVMLLTLATTSQAANKWGLKEGSPELKSAGHLAFGPDGVLFIGDAKGAQIVAIDTGDAKGEAAKAKYDIANLNEALSAAVGGSKVTVNDLVVNPASGNLFLSVSKADGQPGLIKIDATGKASEISLTKATFQKLALPNPPEDKVTGEGPRARNRRNEAITDLAYSDGKLLVTGMTADAAPSNVREITFPFVEADPGTQVEIYHGAHGKLEDYAAIRAFVPLTIDGQPSILAGFTCTPLVRFSVNDLDAGKKVRGTTVAELGNRNQPLDIVLYEKGGDKFLLIANTNRGVMKVSTKDIGRKDGITERISNTAGQAYETIADLQGTVQLDKLTDTQAVVVVNKDGALALKTVALP